MAVPYLQIITLSSSGTEETLYNTFTTWGLIPDGRLTVAPAALQEKYLEIPGMNGELDISEILTGSPKFKNRTGTWEFYLVPFGYAFTADGPNFAMQNKTPAAMAQTIYSNIHGKRVKVLLWDDLTHCYTGRVKVKSWSPNKAQTKISIEYNLAPARATYDGNLGGNGEHQAG